MHTRRLPSLLVCLAALLSGCASLPGNVAPTDSVPLDPTRYQQWVGAWSLEDPRLSQPRFEAFVREPIPIVANDGVRLDAWVLRPDTTDRLPTILRLSPYFNFGGPGVEKAMKFNPDFVWPYADDYRARGYAVAYVNPRGTGFSGGCLDWQGARDRADANAILDAITAQPWSNGRIGAAGISWEGTTLNSIALSGHPALKTIIPAASISDWHRWPFFNGVPWSYVGYTWNLYSLGLVGNDRPGCLDPLGAQATGLMSGPTGVRNPWWDERNMSLHTQNVRPELAVLFVHGYQDGGVRTDHLPPWVDALKARGVKPHFVMGQWNHLWPDWNNTTLLPEKFRMDDWSTIQLRWFEHHLLGKDTGIQDMPTVITQDTRGRFHAQDQLQPADAKRVRLFPSPGAKLGEDASSGEARFHDVGKPATAEAGSHAVSFATSPFPEAARFVGGPVMRLLLDHSAARGQVSAALYVVEGDDWRIVTSGMSNYNLRSSAHRYDPVLPGTAFEVTVPLLLHDFVIEQGQRLGLVLGSGLDCRIVGPTDLKASPTCDVYGMQPPASGGVTTVRLGPQSFLDLTVSPAHLP